jgi:hypothetical protein
MPEGAATTGGSYTSTWKACQKKVQALSSALRASRSARYAFSSASHAYSSALYPYKEICRLAPSRRTRTTRSDTGKSYLVRLPKKLYACNAAPHAYGEKLNACNETLCA